MAAQLGLYPNFVGESRNAPPSNDDMARVAAGVLADPPRHAGRRLPHHRAPKLIGVHEITAAMSKVLGRKSWPINAPEWLLNKVAAYPGVRRATTWPPSITTSSITARARSPTARRAKRCAQGDRQAGREPSRPRCRPYAGRPEVQRNAGAFGKALAEFMPAPALARL